MGRVGEPESEPTSEIAGPLAASCPGGMSASADDVLGVAERKRWVVELPAVDLHMMAR